MFSEIIRSIGISAGCALVGIGVYLYPPHQHDMDHRSVLSSLRIAEQITADIAEDVDKNLHTNLWDGCGDNAHEPVCVECRKEQLLVCAAHKKYKYEGPPPRKEFSEEDAESYCQTYETQRRLNKLAGVFGLTYPVTGAFTEYMKNLDCVELPTGALYDDPNYGREWLRVLQEEMDKRVKHRRRLDL